MPTTKLTGGKLYGGSEHTHKPQLQRLPYVNPKGTRKKASPKDYLDFCVYAAERRGLSYGKYMALTTPEERKAAWKRYKARH